MPKATEFKTTTCAKVWQASFTLKLVRFPRFPGRKMLFGSQGWAQGLASRLPRMARLNQWLHRAVLSRSSPRLITAEAEPSAMNDGSLNNYTKSIFLRCQLPAHLSVRCWATVLSDECAGEAGGSTNRNGALSHDPIYVLAMVWLVIQ